MEPVAVLFYGTLCCFYLLFVKHSHGVCVDPLFRVLPFLVLIVSVMAIFAEGNDMTLAQSMSYYLQGLNRVLYGLLFTIISNIYATLPNLHPVYRLFSLSISFGFYFMNFTQDLKIVSVQYIRPVDIVAFLVVCVIMLGVYLYVILHMRRIDRLLYLLFVAVLTVFLWSAVSPALKAHTIRNITRLVGGCFVFVSELCYAVEKWHGPSSVARLLTTPAHYAAQFFMVFSAMRLD